MLKPPPIPTIDETLTVQNANKRGYIWVFDDTYDPEHPETIDARLLEILNKGCILGRSHDNELEERGRSVGIYESLRIRKKYERLVKRYLKQLKQLKELRRILFATDIADEGKITQIRKLLKTKSARVLNKV